MNPFEPFKPPFAYHPKWSLIADKSDNVIIEISERIKREDMDRLGQLITKIMNQHAEEMEKEPKK